MILQIQSVLICVYMILVKPYEDNVTNKLEIFNEICILLVSCFLITFTEYVSDINIRYSFGWIIIAIASLNILVNTLVMLVITCYG